MFCWLCLMCFYSFWRLFEALRARMASRGREVVPTCRKTHQKRPHWAPFWSLWFPFCSRLLHYGCFACPLGFHCAHLAILWLHLAVFCTSFGSFRLPLAFFFFVLSVAFGSFRHPCLDAISLLDPLCSLVASSCYILRFGSYKIMFLYWFS